MFINLNSSVRKNSLSISLFILHLFISVWNHEYIYFIWESYNLILWLFIFIVQIISALTFGSWKLSIGYWILSSLWPGIMVAWPIGNQAKYFNFYLYLVIISQEPKIIYLYLRHISKDMSYFSTSTSLSYLCFVLDNKFLCSPSIDW